MKRLRLLRAPARRGLTLAESAISAVFVGVTLVAALDAVSAARSGLRSVSERRRGHQLARDLMTEILEQAYADPEDLSAIAAEVYASGFDGSADLGPDSGEDAPGDRSLFDDVDDYDGWSASPPQHEDGTQMDDLATWRREVEVVWVQPGSWDTTSSKERGTKRITVTTYAGDVPRAELVTFVTIGPPPQEGCCMGDGMCVDLIADVCTEAGGVSQGPGTSCLNDGCPEPSECLIARWRFDDLLGSTASDTTGEHDGILYGPYWSIGVMGGCLSFDGTNDYVSVADHPDLSLTQQFTLAAWIRADGFDAYRMVVSKGTAGAYGNYWLGTAGDEIAFGFCASTQVEFQTSTLNLNPYTWYHVAATYDRSAGEVRVYLNGIPVLQESTGSIPQVSISSLSIGRTQAGQYFDGKIDDVRIYGCVLSAEEVGALASGDEP